MDNYNRIRVRHSKAEKIVNALRKEGFDADYLGAGTANPVLTKIVDKENDVRKYFNHPCARKPYEWGSILTNATGVKTHDIIQQLYPCVKASTSPYKPFLNN